MHQNVTTRFPIMLCMSSTSLGRPPGFMAIALTNSGETHRMGERTGTSEPSSERPSLVMQRRGRAGSSKDAARAWTPDMTCQC